MFAGDLTTPDYSRQLTAIAQALNRPPTPVWLVSLISAGLGAAAAVVAEPFKARVKLWADDIHDLRKELRQALVRQEALMHALNCRIRSERINHGQLRSVYILNQVKTSAITYLLEYKKELLMREGSYEWVLNVRDLLEQVKIQLANVMGSADADKSIGKEQVEVFGHAVHDAWYVMWSPFDTSRIKNWRYRRRFERESAGIARVFDHYERNEDATVPGQ